jgi:hypothetical protein
MLSKLGCFCRKKPKWIFQILICFYFGDNMFSKKIIMRFFTGSLLLAANFAALADDYTTAPYVGIQAGYGNTNWDNLTGYDVQENNAGFATRLFAGYDFMPHVAVEAGYTYFSPTEMKLNGRNLGDIDTHAFDVLAKLNTRFANNVGAYIKAGPGYLYSDGAGIANNVGNIDLVYGVGLDYPIAPNLLADIAWTRHNGYGKLNSNYQPNADLYAVGIVYKFNANL